MANKTFNTRIRLRIDSHENWVKNDPVLMLGEAAICTVSIIQDDVTSVPSTLIKIGDGEHKYSDLDYINAKAADVHAWAKQSTKPIYTAQEIHGIDDYISGKINDTNTTYTIVKINDNQYKLMSKNVDDDSFNTEVATIDIPKAGDSETVEQLVLDVAKLNGTAETEGSVNYKIAQAIASVMENPDTTMNSIKELVDWIESHAKDAIELNNKVAALEAKMGDTNVQTQIDTAITNLKIDQYTKSSDLAAVAKSGLIDDLSIGDDTTLVFDCGTSV